MQIEFGNDVAIEHRPTKRLIVPIIGVVLCFSALCAYLLFESRRETGARATDVATGLVAAMESDIARNIETIDLSLQAVVDNLQIPGIEQMDADLRQRILFDRSATVRHVDGIRVLDEFGNLRLDSRTIRPANINFAERDYFQAH